MAENGSELDTINIRSIAPEDTERFFEMLCQLDEETEYMLYEPGERRKKTPDPERLRGLAEAAAAGEDVLLLIAEDADGEIAGFLSAQRGGLNRIRHTAYIVTGIRRAWRRQGIGTEFFRRLEEWAREKGVVRLELTVECPNTGAKSLYEKCGFAVEGIKRASVKVNGSFVDEYCMARILD